MEKLVPYRATSPGEILIEELKERKIKQRRFAYLIDMRPSDFNNIIKGKKRVNEFIADKIESVLGISSKFWVRMQKTYESDRKKIAMRNKIAEA